MPTDRTPQAVLDELAGHPRGDDLARLVHTIAFAAADERRSALSEGLTEAADRAGLSAEDADTRFGNVLRLLSRADGEGVGGAGALLLSTLLGRGVALSPPEGAEAEVRVAEALVWIAANTPLDALSALDATLGDAAEGLWRAIAEIVRRADAGNAPLVGRAGALVAAAGLRASASSLARAEVKVLAGEVRDPVVRSLLREAGSRPGAVSGDAAVATGELVPAPFGPVALVLLAVTGVLFVILGARLFARWVLRYRRPAEMRVSAGGVTVAAKTEMLGRTLREQEVHVPVEALLTARREVRFPRLGLYAGLFALAAGSYVGIALFVDGARAGSPELLGMGALIVALGVALDFALMTVGAGAPGRCRVVVVPRKGAALALERVNQAAADAALSRLIPRA